MTVSLVRFDGSLDSLRQAIELCAGFDRLGTSDRVLIKPNNCFRHKVMPPYGMVTTCVVVEGIVRLLLEYGCKDVSIGEGAIIGIFDELEPYTKRGFRGTGIEKLRKKYGVKLLDFNHGPFQELDLEGIKIQVSKAALESDFLINIPVLKTHFQAKVSLGFKNLKGCLSRDSKKRFHTSKRLDRLICLLNEAIKSDLVIIDGIYMLEKGPETLAGIAQRKNLIIASPDIFECDIVGATVLGVDPSQVGYLQEFAQRHNRSLDINSIEIKGLNINSVREQLNWYFEPDDELLTPAGIKGIVAPSPGQTLCTGCGATLALALSIFGKDSPKKDFSDVELCYGLELKPQKHSNKIFLYGDCAIRSNKSWENAIRVKGCPPSLVRTLLVLAQTLLNRPAMLKMVLLEVAKLIRTRLGLYHGKEMFSKWERYRAKEFDKSHF